LHGGHHAAHPGIIPDIIPDIIPGIMFIIGDICPAIGMPIIPLMLDIPVIPRSVVVVM